MKQACAAVGQAILMNGYESICDLYGLKCAQILVNHDDFEDRNRLLHLENTLNALIENDVIPIVNENDALAVEEIMVGDNDTLAALIAPIVSADRLVLLSDIDGLYTDNPKTNPNAKFIRCVNELTKEIMSYGHDSSTSVGTGGMMTKLKAASIATSAGIDMIIMNANHIDRLHNAYNEEFDGTLFRASKDRMTSRSHWILYKTRPHGNVYVDFGCKNALIERKSLLAKGIIASDGIFEAGDVVNILYNNEVVAKGIVNYNVYDINKIKGLPSSKINEVLGYKGKSVVSHANNIVIIDGWCNYEL